MFVLKESTSYSYHSPLNVSTFDLFTSTCVICVTGETFSPFKVLAAVSIAFDPSSTADIYVVPSITPAFTAFKPSLDSA